MSNEDQNLDRMRQILKRMERSIDDARDRRLRGGEEQPPNAQGLSSQAIGQSNPATQQQPANNPGAVAKPTGPVRFDEDGRPIVGRAKPKNTPNGPQNNSPYSSGSNWR